MPEPGIRDGVEGTAYVEEFFRVFDRNHTTVLEVIDIGDDRVVFMVHHSVRGAVSGAGLNAMRSTCGERRTAGSRASTSS